ncbi:MAG: aminotransferase class V-fold PLP-dependent enzyme [Pseudohongiella sp.]|uniref:aminotransferase class V-fold PLP-dependent enzyme n=1 Tax=Pseudohongiella sp. TaxID=1979412 RepID=UPI0034A065B0
MPQDLDKQPGGCPTLNRRRLLKAGAAGLAAATTTLMARDAWSQATDGMPTTAMLPDTSNDIQTAAADNNYWHSVRSLYDVPTDLIHLEHGNWGMMTKSVHATYLEELTKVNRHTSYYGRELFAEEQTRVMQQVADVLDVSTDEIAPVRNATEALTALIGGYRKLKPGDGVLYADLDYPSMQGAMRWLVERRGVSVHTVNLPEPASMDSIISTYESALKSNRHIRLLLVTHISHRTGLLLPVRDIIAMARRYDVDVILDSAHAWGQVDFALPDTGADFVGLNLHKWMGAPLGLGLIYIKRSRLGDIERHMVRGGGSDTDSIYARTGIGTNNLAAQLTIPAALNVHQTIGPALKNARLRRLRDLWAERLREHPRIEILTPADPSLYAGITSFRIKGQTSTAANTALAKKLWQQHRIFVVQRDGLASGSCVRVTPAVYTLESEVDALADALETIA